ncbi:NAD(P)-dependent oxidoreductase [Metapseudomonas resinovorans]|uniref:NAD(P)-dependent oxidoreductase n=1 Tax=Metapseudomonas resinovorans TaxID=53412 RepID=UPI000491637B|nr:NAD(P)-dependent oxidoreductase [Pseudomonas resinovorans]
MKIVVFGAFGRAGRCICHEAVQRGHEVVAISRSIPAKLTPNPLLQSAKGDATNPSEVGHLVRGADAVVNCISPRPSLSGPACSLVDAARALVSGLKQASVTRLLVVGGAGSLEVEPGVPLKSLPDFPPAYLPEATAQGQALEIYQREAGGLDWTYLSPAVFFNEGERRGCYRITGDNLLTDAEGVSAISFADYAMAVVDELEQPRHIGQRFGVAY